MEMKDKLENQWKIYQMINELTRFSDSKAAASITFNGIFYVLFFSSINGSNTFLSFSWLSIILAVLTFITSSISIIYSFLCIIPTLGSKGTKSIFYFDHIAEHPKSIDYLLYSKQIYVKDDELFEQLSEQIYINSKIARKKFRNVNVSMRFLFATIGLLIINILINCFKL